jgi:cobalamin biosynthesis protein CobD/CbiB
VLFRSHDHFNAGGVRHGWLAWTVGALLPAAVAGIGAGLLHALSPPLVWALGFASLYFAMGYRRVELGARDMVGALTVRDTLRARHFCTGWCADPGADADAEGLAREGIRAVLRLALERRFGVIFWTACLGLPGTLLYVLTRYLADRWRDDADFGAPARRALYWLDWLPARALAFSFAIAGNFDHALAVWRALRGKKENTTLVIAAGAGALGLNLSGATDPDLAWDAPGSEYLEGAVRLVWRALLLWLLILALLWLAGR